MQPQLVVQRILRQATPTATRRSRIAVSVLQTRSYLLMPTSVTLQAQRFFSDDTSTSKEAEEGIDRSKFTEEIKVYMPEMGEGEGKILKWYKQEGDLVLKDDILCDIETKVGSDLLQCII